MNSFSLAAEKLGAGLPPLLVAAERVAATVAQGLHGRRRVGVGENFWQFRPFVAGDARGRIDWRQSAKSDRLYVRETEWEAAQTVALWREGGASMRWRSDPALPEKAERAELLLLALASLLLRGGERVRLLAGAQANAARVTAGRPALAAIAAALGHSPAGFPLALPPAHGRVVLFGDFLGSAEEIRALIDRLASLPVRGELVQLLDPAEIRLPYRGRVRFEPVDAGRAVVIGRVEAVRAAYAARLAERQALLGALAKAAGFGFAVHRTDAAPQAALLGLYEALAGR